MSTDVSENVKKELELEEVKPCENCQGTGRVVVGVYLVTKDMALDAQDPILIELNQKKYGIILI